MHPVPVKFHTALQTARLTQDPVPPPPRCSGDLPSTRLPPTLTSSRVPVFTALGSSSCDHATQRASPCWPTSPRAGAPPGGASANQRGRELGTRSGKKDILMDSASAFGYTSPHANHKQALPTYEIGLSLIRSSAVHRKIVTWDLLGWEVKIQARDNKHLVLEKQPPLEESR